MMRFSCSDFDQELLFAANSKKILNSLKNPILISEDPWALKFLEELFKWILSQILFDIHERHKDLKAMLMRIIQQNILKILEEILLTQGISRTPEAS